MPCEGKSNGKGIPHHLDGPGLSRRDSIRHKGRLENGGLLGCCRCSYIGGNVAMIILILLVIVGGVIVELPDGN